MSCCQYIVWRSLLGEPRRSDSSRKQAADRPLCRLTVPVGADQLAVLLSRHQVHAKQVTDASRCNEWKALAAVCQGALSVCCSR